MSVCCQQGPRGPRGSDGIQGTHGTQGAQGAQGDFGGPPGPQGAQGATGATGAQGSQGAGFQGAQGFQGAAGAAGAAGATGSQGAQGAAGTNGATGAQGAQGFQGTAGSGSQGAQGASGADGAAGANGAQGSQGSQGAQGIIGSVAAILTPESAALPGSNAATRETQDGSQFSDLLLRFAQNQYVTFQFIAVRYSSGDLTAVLNWWSNGGATTGTATWEISIACITGGDAVSVLAKTLASVQTGSNAPNGTAKGLVTTTITITNLDSIAPGDVVWVKLKRTDASVTGDLNFTSGYILYAAA